MMSYCDPLKVSEKNPTGTRNDYFETKTCVLLAFSAASSECIYLMLPRELMPLLTVVSRGRCQAWVNNTKTKGRPLPKYWKAKTYSSRFDTGTERELDQSFLFVF
jgi:hypothetical protein